MAKVTGFDVARLAGVSQPTVSRALRNLPGTSPETRRKVMEAAERLGYVPSESGRILSTRTTRRIAVVSEELTNPYYPQILEPLRVALAEAGLRIVVVVDTESEAIGHDLLTDGSYDGVVLTTTRRRSTLPRDLTARGVPHVLVNRVLDYPESPACAPDNAQGIRQIVDLLAGLGHKRVATVQGPVDTSTGKERADALRQGLRRHGLPVRRDWMIRSEFTHDAAFAAVRPLLEGRELPTAIVCGNDVIAMGVLSALRERGLDVPGDVTVTGFDDIALAGWPVVGLTTVRVDLDALAALAVEMLRGAMADPQTMPALTRRVPVSLVTRRTHGVA